MSLTTQVPKFKDFLPDFIKHSTIGAIIGGIALTVIAFYFDCAPMALTGMLLTAVSYGVLLALDLLDIAKRCREED
jgi:hypothetical protein